MRSLGEVAVRLARRVVSAAESRRAAAVVFAGSFVLWWLEAVVIPLAPGRDFGTYMGAYVQLFQSDPIDLGYVLGRTPVVPLVSGGLLELAHGAFAEPAVALLYAASVTAWFVAARRFGAGAAVLITLVLLTYPGYTILFHELSSDSLFAAAFAGWSLLLVRVLREPTPAGFAWLGAGVGFLALVRPSNQGLLALALVPLVLGLSWRLRIASVAAFVVPALAILGGWAVTNGLRYDDYVVVRGGNATVPFYRAFVTDKIVRPSNGPETRQLAEAVQRDLLPNEPYRSYGITLDEFFSAASPRMQVDLLALADRVRGWHSNHRWLRQVGVEAVRAHPGEYARGVTRTMWELLRQGLYRSVDTGAGSPPAGDEGSGTALVAGEALPKPTEGEPIPAPHEGGVTTPDGSIYTVWTSPTEHHLVFVHPGAEARYKALHRRMGELTSRFPDRRGSPALARRLNQSSRWYPPPALWLLVGVVALAVRRPRGALALVAPAAAAFLVLLVSALGLPAEPHYTVPVAPAFVLLAAGALLGPRRSRGEAW